MNKREFKKDLNPELTNNKVLISEFAPQSKAVLPIYQA